MQTEIIAESPLFSVYVHRLYALALAVVEACDEVFELAPVPAKDMYLTVHPRLHARIDGALIDAANIRRLLETNSARGRRESRATHEYRVARARMLASLVSDLELSALLDPRVRNSLEHFDEYLDKLNADLMAGGQAPGEMAAYNMAISHWEVMTPRFYPLRLYVAVEHTYYNMGRAIDLQAVRDQASLLAQALEAMKAAGGEPWGGLLLRMAPHVEPSEST